MELERDGNDDPICDRAKETEMYRRVFWTPWGRRGQDDWREVH